jgi:hypothetical protein
MHKVILPLIGLMIVTGTALAQKQSLGLRMGDPVGVTYKRYTHTNKAIEFIFGTASPNWRRNYYENSFHEYDKYDGYIYRSHKLDNPVYLQARYLMHYNIPAEGMEGALQWYWGLGAMLKFGKVEYRYQEGPPGNNPRTDVRNTIDFGPDGIAGVEYTFEDVPLNVYGEVSLLIELADRPVTLQAFGAVGVRFIF